MPQHEWITSNDLAFAIYDRFPVSAGHALVIPQREVPTWLEATRTEKVALLDLADEVLALLARLQPSPDGFNVGVNIGAAGGQTVWHLHLHVIPRYDGDTPDPRGGIRAVIPERKTY